MNTTDEKQQCELFDYIASLLHPLVSQYDLSEQNLKQQLHNNAYFYRAVKDLTHIIFKNTNMGNDRDRTIRDIEILLKSLPSDILLSQATWRNPPTKN